MKRLPLILNIVLGVAVIALYIFHFTGIGAGHKSASSLSLSSAIKDGNGIYYVKIDSVIGNFKMAKDLTGDLEKKFNASDATLKSRQESYQRDVNDYQYKAQRGLITRSDAQTIEQQLYTKQQELVRLQQDLSNEISEQQAVMNRQVINAIMEYMEENSAELKYKYVLGTSFGGNILYANDSLDITQNVIEGLNTKYTEEKKQDK
jgi:outer membrane protein